MNAVGPHTRTSRSMRSGTRTASFWAVRRPRTPAQASAGESAEQTGMTVVSWRSDRPMTSARWTRSAGECAACTCTTDDHSGRLRSPFSSSTARVRIIDRNGVIPLPADRYSAPAPGRTSEPNTPYGPSARSVSPTRRRSCTNAETGPPGTRLTVIVSSSTPPPVTAAAELTE